MTAANHVVTGAVIALAVRHPIPALALAFVSHFLLDSLPHFGLGRKAVLERNNNQLFRAVLGVDIALTIAAFVFLPLLSGAKISGWLVILCMFLAVSPDLVWVKRFVQEKRTQSWQPEKGFSRFHKRIQWCERPWGLVIEVGLFLCLMGALTRLI